MVSTKLHGHCSKKYPYTFPLVSHADALQSFLSQTTGSPSAVYEPHKQHNMVSNYKGLYGIFNKMSMEVVIK